MMFSKEIVSKHAEYISDQLLANHICRVDRINISTKFRVDKCVCCQTSPTPCICNVSKQNPHDNLSNYARRETCRKQACFLIEFATPSTRARDTFFAFPWLINSNDNNYGLHFICHFRIMHLARTT